MPLLSYLSAGTFNAWSWSARRAFKSFTAGSYTMSITLMFMYVYIHAYICNFFPKKLSKMLTYHQDRGIYNYISFHPEYNQIYADPTTWTLPKSSNAASKLLCCVHPMLLNQSLHFSSPNHLDDVGTSVTVLAFCSSNRTTHLLLEDRLIHSLGVLHPMDE